MHRTKKKNIMTTKLSVLNSNVNKIITLVKKHDMVRYKLIACQLTGDTFSVLLPMTEHCSSTLHLNSQYMQCCGLLS
jgi:hypothetical protein